MSNGLKSSLNAKLPNTGKTWNPSPTQCRGGRSMMRLTDRNLGIVLVASGLVQVELLLDASWDVVKEEIGIALKDDNKAPNNKILDTRMK